MHDSSFSKSLLVSIFFHIGLIFILIFFYNSFFVTRTPLMMDLTLIGEMSKGSGLGSSASNSGEVPNQLPQAQTNGNFSNPQKQPANPSIQNNEKPEVTVHRPLKPQAHSGNASSEAYLQSLDKTSPIGLSINKDVTDQIETTAGLGHMGVAGSPDGNANIEGELASRIVKKKFFPQYPDWAKKQGVEGTVKFNLTVLPNGLLKDDLQLEQTSGYSELDRVVYEALIQWEFEPLPPELPQTDQSGIITFSFNLKNE